MAKRYPHPNGRKPPPPVRNGPTRSTFDGCAVLAFLALGGLLALIALTGYGILKVVTA